MGSGQSAPSHDTSSELSSSSPSINNPSPNENNKENKVKPKPPKNETGYDRATRVCRKKKRAYDACYTAQLTSKEEDCDELFETYRTCFLRVIAKDMERRGVKVSENSMIGEYKAEEAEEDDNNI